MESGLPICNVLLLFIEQLRTQDRDLKKVNRDLARDRTGLERQEKLLVGCTVGLGASTYSFGLFCFRPSEEF